MPVVDLTVDRNLLCPNFDGYKLSFDAVPVLRQGFDRDPLKLEPHLNQYSLLHVELFAKHNLLFSDPWARHNSYYMNTAHQLVLCSYDEQHGQPRAQRVVYTMRREDHGDGYQHLVGDYNYTLRFISEKYCVVCDGMLTFHLLETGDRMRDTSWQLVTRSPVTNDMQQRGFVLYDARLDMVQERKQISLIAGHVRRREAAAPHQADVHVMQLIWSRWTLDSQPEASWSYKLCEQLETPGSIYYCAFEPRADSLVVCSNGQLQTLAQLKAEAEQAAAAATAAEAQLNHDNEPSYSWTQTEQDVIVRFPLRSGATRDEFNISCTPRQALVKRREETLLQGVLYADVEDELTSWTVEGQTLQLTLVKQRQEQWPRLLQTEHVVVEAVKEEQPAEQPAEPEDDSEMDIEPEPERLPIPNLEDPIEECDFPLGNSDDDIKMVRFNLSTSGITHTIFMGAIPPLFATSLRAGYPAAFVTRQGVDASVWLQLYQPAKPGEWSVRHEGNLHAFGYVQASKQQRKFIDCCPQLDYAVISESYRHVFIYKPRYDSAGGLRNRNGPQVVIGKQNLVTLDDDLGEVLGLVTATNVITVLTEHAVLYLQV
ncbi:nudC domain-containing protein 1 [Drosophila montana]|uniref:nudC domain-containing protein 1 n=1 Tax=Drosophila montana TaxID=40370 RepID=UPI00313DE3A3